ncbi:hypothetical protein [Microbacterium hydrocarbonoxydans]|uniref:hypothetical protein n=1 Tax=Microbacterium hydrocarbonoxydans TaxID=273678 RepID=UPI0020406AC7|nr:hypothetical protein [Microbacterium hydrocarbonoxydans]MCM3779069.1 hypothetical protein [Microbacterium hydrocarbonoxydans]
MTSDSDDDALSWDGDEGRTPKRLPREDAGRRAPGEDAAAEPSLIEFPTESSTEPARSSDAALPVGAEHDAAVLLDDERPALSTGMLLAVGVVGGIYLLYSVGWIVGGLRLKPLANFFVADAMFLPWFVLAVAAPALWFLAGWVLTRGKATWIRLSVLLLGVVLLVPWPFVTVGAIGS